MAIYMMRTLADIRSAIMEQLKIQSTDTVSKNRITRNINMAYDEIMSFARWPWARGQVSLTADSYFGTGTASVISNSVTVTLSSTVSPSRTGFFFAVQGYSEVYRIKSHTAGSATLQLETPFNGTTNSAISFKIWSDTIPLPVDLQEIIEIRHQFSDKPLENMGLQEFRRIQELNPQGEGRPNWHTLSDYKTPSPYTAISGMPASVTRSSSALAKSIVFAADVVNYLAVGERVSFSGSGDYTYNIEAVISSVSGTTITYTGVSPLQESLVADTGITVQTMSVAPSYDRYRELMVYPAVSQYRTTLHIDYGKMAQPLENDSDEPLMPIRDRMALFYGGMAFSADREKDPESSNKYYALFEQRLSKMASKSEDSPDKPVIQVSKNYLASKRLGQRSRDYNGLSRSSGLSAGWGGGGSSSPSGTVNSVAVFDTSGSLIGSQVINTTELSFLDNASPLTSTALAANTTTTVATWSLASFDAFSIYYSLKRGSVREVGKITLITDGSTIAMAVGDVAQTGSTGVTFDAVTSAGNVSLTAALTAGSAGTLQYATQKWLS